MEDSELIKVILTSSLIAGIFSAIVSAIISIKLKNLDYKNEYFKQILKKRLYAYNLLESQIAVLKSTVLGDDAKPYHMIFSFDENKLIDFQKNLFGAMSHNLWINEDTIQFMEKLNELFFKISEKIEGNIHNQLVQIGKEYYFEIADLRNLLEDSVRKDLLNLHNLKKFKKSSKPNRLRLIAVKNKNK